MKIGLLGGSFNPIHRGHLYIAEKAVEKQLVDQVWLVPSFSHPFAHKQNMTDFSLRVDLIKKAIAHSEFCSVCDLEKELDPPTYTSKLIQLLFTRFPQHSFYFMIGCDIIAELPKWNRFDWLRQNVNFVVITRNTAEDVLPEINLEHYQYLDVPPVDISSTLIRERIKRNQPIKGLVPDNIIAETISIYSSR